MANNEFRIEELKNEIKSCAVLIEIGMAAYERDKDVDMLHSAVYWEHEKRVLMHELEKLQDSLTKA